MSSRRLLSWLFALSLLFGQAAAFAHALTHLKPRDSALPDKVCELCVAQVQLDAAVAPSLVVLAMPHSDCTIAPANAPKCIDLAPRPACARAPPASSDT